MAAAWSCSAGSSRGLGPPSAMPVPQPVPGPERSCPAEAGGRNRTWQFTNTKLCKFEIMGMCAKGEACPFAHTKGELRALPDLTCTKLCKTLIQTGACENPGCTYAHTKEELRATSTFHKTKLCRFSQLGHCALGAKCNFAHSPDEIRKLDPPPAEGGEGGFQQQAAITPYFLQEQVPIDRRQRGSQPQYFLGQSGQAAGNTGMQPHAGGCPSMAAATPTGPSGRSRGGRGGLQASARVPPHVSAAGLPASGQGGVRRRRDARVRDAKGGRVVCQGFAEDLEAVDSGVNREAVGTTLDEPDVNVQSMDNLGISVGALGSVAGMGGLEWMAAVGAGRQGGPMSQLSGSSGSSHAMHGAAYGGGPAVAFSSATLPLATGVPDAYRDSPAYVTQMASDFIVRSTYSQMRPIGGPLRSIRSAPHGLYLHGSEHDDFRDLAAGLPSDRGIGLAIGSDPGKDDPQGQVAPRSGPASSSAGDQHNSGLTASRPTLTGFESSASASSTADGWDAALYKSSITVDQKDDTWQVKNTFLTFSPQKKPIRSVRTAEGALCTLGGIDDEE